jgi:hypothetical protein
MVKFGRNTLAVVLEVVSVSVVGKVAFAILWRMSHR